MKHIVFVLVYLFALDVLAEQLHATNRPPSVKEILDSVLAQMPSEPVLIKGRLGVRDRGQSILQSYKVEIRLHITGGELSGRYTVFDMLGSSLEQLRVSRQAGRNPGYEYSVGNPLLTAPTPDIFSHIRDTGLTWADLSLPFLWWRDGVIVGHDAVKDRDCFVIDVRPPATESGAERAVLVRVWIDQKYRMLLQADEYGANLKMLRRLSVQSFKKINDEWMIKDVIVSGSTNLPSGYKSFVTIQDIRSVNKSHEDAQPPSKAEADAADSEK